MYGSEKWVVEEHQLKRWAYRLFGEIAVPGRIRNNHVLQAIRRLKLHKKPVKFLDAGSGKGDLSIHLARKYPQWEVAGYELEESKISKSLRIAEHFDVRNVKYERGRLEELPYADSFDLVTCLDVLEHIEDDRTVIRRLFRSLKPGGVLIITAPSVPQRKHLSLVHRREQRIGFTPADYGHVRDGYGKDDVKEKFETAGGRVQDSYYTFGPFGTLAFDISFVIGDNQPHPALYATLFPFLVALGVADLHYISDVGSAILAIGVRPPAEATDRGN